MSADIKPIPQSVKPGQILIVGRINYVSKYDGRYDHVVAMAAPDAYSMPSLARVNSEHALGDVGEEVKVLCAFKGWPNNYESNGKKVQDVRGFFVVVE